MLQELLLSLAGYPSSALKDGAQLSDASSPISPAEREMLKSLLQISDQHLKLRHTATKITISHPSSTCKSVANAIVAANLESFKKAVLDVEQRILSKQADFVGAYNIVPLTTIVVEFAPWARRLDWLGRLVEFMVRPKGTTSEENNKCTGALLICRLREELQTGYADLESLAAQLLEVAERDWLKQASAWLLYGRLPTHANDDDFFIRQVDETVGDTSQSRMPSEARGNQVKD
jgi:hypothetical protein